MNVSIHFNYIKCIRIKEKSCKTLRKNIHSCENMQKSCKTLRNNIHSCENMQKSCKTKKKIAYIHPKVHSFHEKKNRKINQKQISFKNSYEQKQNQTKFCKTLKNIHSPEILTHIRIFKIN